MSGTETRRTIDASKPVHCTAGSRCATRPAHWVGGRLTAGLAWLLLLPSQVLPAQLKPSEYAVKAAYLLNFGKFMRLSEDASNTVTSFNICIVGDDPFGRTLDDMTANEQIDGRPIKILRLEKPDSRACAIAYFSTSDRTQIERDLADLRGSDTLTVSDAPDFLKRGGMIQFLLVSDHVRFSVNLEPVRRSHLTLSSDLLRVAVSVSGNRVNGVQP